MLPWTAPYRDQGGCVAWTVWECSKTWREVGSFSRVAAMLALAILRLPGRCQLGHRRRNHAPRRAYKASGTAKQTRVDIEFSRDPAMNWFLLRGPYRLVIDLPRTEFALDPRSLEATRACLRRSLWRDERRRSRLILTAKKPFKVEKLDIPTSQDDCKWPFRSPSN